MLLDYTQSSMSTYTADCSGVASALYELGGMTVIHDASGCNSTYTTHDEPRWNTMPSAVFISALTEMDAVLGNDSRIIDDIVDAARKLTPAFVAIAGTPIPMMTGVDLKGIARLVESRTRIPSFAVQTNSMRAYSVGCAQAWIELSRRFVVPNGARAGSFGINLLGATPLDFSTGGMLESLRAAAARAGYTINACWAMGDKLESLANTAAARVNVVVSSSGLPLAQCFERCFGTPYVCGLPVGGLAPRWHAAVEWAAKNRCSVPAADFLGADAGGTRTAVLGEPLAACTAAAVNLEQPGSCRALSPLPSLGIEAPILSSNLSEDLLRAMLGGTEVLAADPLFDIIAEEARVGRTIAFPLGPHVQERDREHSRARPVRRTRRQSAGHCKMTFNLKQCALVCGALALAATSAAARTVVDDNGTSVEIPDHVNRVVVTNILPLASAVTVFLNDGKTVVGMHPASYSAAKSGLLGKLYPDVLKADTSFMQGASLNVEALMALRPDLVLVNAPDKRTLDAVRNAGIPAFGISPSKWHYDIIETHAQWMKSLSEIWPEHKGKGDLIDSRSKAIAKMVADRTKDLRPEERSKVLFLFRYDARQIVTSGRNFFGQYWCDAVGARNVAESVTADNANAIVSMEQIYAWNPDVVFITNFTAATPADLFDNKMAGHDWSDVKAVKDKRVYKLPLGIYRSYTPSADTPLTLLWIAKQVYPSRFADIDLTKEVKAWYKDVFGVTLTDADVDMMFNPGEGASTGATVATRSNG